MKEGGKRAQRVVRDTTTWLGMFFELNADGSVDAHVSQTCCLEPVLNTRAQACSEAFWRPRASHSVTTLWGTKNCTLLVGTITLQNYAIQW